jgi:hypothetical protein
MIAAGRAATALQRRAAPWAARQREAGSTLPAQETQPGCAAAVCRTGTGSGTR